VKARARPAGRHFRPHDAVPCGVSASILDLRGFARRLPTRRL